MQGDRGYLDKVKIFFAECFLLGLFILFMRVEHIIGILILIFGMGACWYIYDKLENVQISIREILKREKIFSMILTFVILVCVPIFLKDSVYLLNLCIWAGIYVMLATGLNYQIGSTNIVNLATAASYGIGAYTSALISVHTGISFWLVILIAGCASGFMGFILGLPTLKTKDYYLTLVTLAFGLIVYLVLNNLEFTGGPNGIGDIPPPTIFGYSFRQDLHIFGMTLPYHVNFYYLVLFLASFYTLISNRLYHSRVGLTWNAIREDEIAAKCVGINTTNYKILSFVINCFLDGMTGAVYAHYVSFISPENFQFFLSVVVVTMVILGGIDNVFGVVFGAVLLTLLPEKFRVFQDFRLMLYGVIVIATLIFRPKGLFPQKLRKYAEG